MVKSGHVAGSYLFIVIKNNIPTELAPEILENVFMDITPKTINLYLDVD